MSIIAENDATVPQAAETSKHELHQRVLSAVVLVPAVLAIVYVGGWPFMALVALAAIIMILEWHRLTGAGRDGVIVAVQSLITIGAIMLTLQDALAAAVAVMLAGALLLAGLARWRGGEPAWPAVGMVWLTLPCLAVVWLRSATEAGFELLFGLLLVVWACDTAAYFAGRGIGGPRLAPSWSPGKTWAGLAGGCLGSAATAALWAHVTGLATPAEAASAGAVLAVVAQIGDLSESAVKRRFGVKDSGKLIPGHGGLLDRVDGLLFAAPATAILVLLGGRGMV